MPQVSPATMPIIYPCLSYREPMAAMEWLTRAFGFVKRAAHPGPDGTIAHAEMSFGSGVIMLGSARPEFGWLSAQDLPAVNQTIYVVVDDPDGHYARAKAAGARIVLGLKDEDYGSRGYTARDLEGNYWSFGTYRPGGDWEA
ncbi:MAG: VOC family protein [Gammaproteobacteria bacterium]